MLICVSDYDDRVELMPSARMMLFRKPMVHYIPVSPGQLRMSELRLINSVAGLLTQTEEDKLKAADTGGSEEGGGGDGAADASALA
jgi:hypothetical protein